MLATILCRQGVHPNPGPSGHEVVSILDDECWDLWGWASDSEEESFVTTCPDEELGGVGLREPRATVPIPTVRH